MQTQSHAGHIARIGRSTHDMLRAKFGMYFSTLQVEGACLDEDSTKAIDVTRAASAMIPKQESTGR